MFRVKNSQAVIGVQTILPKLIALLLLITFSYAIVGLIVDLMYLVFYLIINAFTTFGIIRTGLLGGQPLMVKAASGQYGMFISFIIQTFLAGLVAPSAVIASITGLPQGLGVVIDSILNGIGIGLIVRIILALAIVYTFFKLFISLLGAYINVVIQLIFAPIILLGGVFPGSKTIGDWFRNIIANMSVFPSTMTLLLLAYVFMAQPIVGPIGALGVKDLASGGMLNPPLIFATNPSTSSIMAVIGVGILLMASKYVTIIKEALKVPPFKYGSAIGDALKSGRNTTFWPVKTAIKLGTPAGSNYLKTKLKDRFGPGNES